MGITVNYLEGIKEELKSSVSISSVDFPKVSIIVPVYNTEFYLKKCLLSLVNQTLKEIEIILVNDESTDDSAKIMNVFAEHDKRIKIINQTHQRQGAARNNGFKIARGEYIGYVDSDDWVDLDYFEKLYNRAKKYNSDIALATNIRIGNGKTKKRLAILEEVFVEGFQEKIDIGNQAKNPCPTNKIYKKTMLENNNIYWPEGVYCEDKMFTIQAVYYANGIVAVPNVNYYYFRNPHSTVNSKDKEHLKKANNDKREANRKVLEFLKEKNVEIRDKDFWAIKEEKKIFNLTLLKIKASLKTEKLYLLGLIPIFERRYK